MTKVVTSWAFMLLCAFLPGCTRFGKNKEPRSSGQQELRQRFDSLLQRARDYESVSDPRFLSCYDSLRALERLLADSLGYVQRMLLGSAHDALSGRVDEAIVRLDSAHNVAKRRGYDQEFAKIYQQYGTAHVIRGDYDLALKYMFEALRLHELRKDTSEIAVSYSNIGLAYHKLRNNEQAIEYYRKRLALGRRFVSGLDVPRTLISIGLAFSDLGQYDSATHCYVRADEMLGNDLSVRDAMLLSFARGKTFVDMNHPEKGEPFLNRSLAIAKRDSDYRFMAEAGAYLARVFIQRNDIRKARIILDEASAIAREHNLKEILLDVYQQYIEVSRRGGGVVELTDWQRKYIELSQTLYNEQLISKISALQVQFEERENIAAIESQEQLLKLQEEAIAKRRLVIILLVAAAVLMVVILYVLRNVSIQRKRMNQALDQEVIRQTQELAARNNAAELEARNLQLRFQDSCFRARQTLATLKGLCAIEELEGEEQSQAAKLMLQRIIQCENVLNRLSEEASEIDVNSAEQEKDQGLS